MESRITLSLKDFGPINKAKIDIGKITVIGGQNSTGKSTSSKMVYSFLKSNSSKRRELAIDTVVKQIIRLLFDLNDYASNTSRRSDSIEDYDPDEIFSLLKDLDPSSTDFSSQLEVYDKIKELYKNLDLRPAFKADIEESIDKIDNLIKTVNENTDSLYSSLMRKLLKSEFSTNKFNGVAQLCGSYKESDFDFLIDFSDSDLNSDDSFESEGWFSIHDVFYFDSFSILDLPQRSGLQNSDHVKFLAMNLREESNESGEAFDEKLNEPIIKIENKINELIGGEFIYDNGELSYVPKDGTPCLMKNTASGIKQIGTIQLLLANRKLKENSCLIIDEPEVNLHPEWQVKFAGILVLISASLDILVYINTHSPLFIEAIDAFSEFYGLADQTNYYLTELEEGTGKFNINKIEHEDLYLIYDDLGKPYGHIDEIRMEAEFN